MNRYGENNEYVLAYEATAVLDGWKLALGQEKADRNIEVSRLKEDYAAMEARCAGLKRERNEAILKLDYMESLRVKWMMDRTDLFQVIKTERAERDALQANLAAAEEALQRIAGIYGAHQAVAKCREIASHAIAILAGHAPATPKGEGDE